MRRNGLLIGGWALATLLALALGLQSIKSVSNSVTDPRPAPLSPASVKAALQRNSSASSSSDAARESDSNDLSPASTGPSFESSGPAASDGGGAGLPAPASSGSDGDNGSQSAPSSSDGGIDGGDDHSSSGSSSTSSIDGQERTYQLVGGTVTIRFEDGAAHLVVATANSGFSVQHSEDGGTVDVRFESSEHESRLRAYWDNGPQQEIEERNEG